MYRDHTTARLDEGQRKAVRIVSRARCKAARHHVPLSPASPTAEWACPQLYASAIITWTEWVHILFINLAAGVPKHFLAHHSSTTMISHPAPHLAVCSVTALSP